MMKKTNKTVFTTALIVFTASMLIINSCKKNENSDVIDVHQETTIDYKEYNEIIAFRQMCEDYSQSNLKSTFDTMTVSEALTNMEASLNLTYCSPKILPKQIGHEKSIYESVFTDLDMDLLPDQISETYWDLKDLVEDDYVNCNLPNKILMIVDLEFIETNHNEYKIITTAIIGDTTLPNGVPSVIQNPNNYFSDWVYGYDGGICYDPTPVSWDAAKELTGALFPIFIDLPVGYVWTQIEQIEFDPLEYPNPNGDPDNYKDYFIFYATNALTSFPIDDDIMCLESEEMEFYDEKALEIFLDWQNDPILNPSGKLYAECFLEGRDGIDISNNYYIIHYIEACYAHLTPIPPTHNPQFIVD